ncbi:hypothetical protein I3760_07G176000 [Carya illinoinensis]|uniref:uncharacterized protein LOC122315461 isoform X2 n=1 Tax=Carya illinoinensis TaxID=32201 RepID=UPI001BF55C02|nr:uncharacterized protein LOC122315461 isoform X2 [Carya illinoinensis]KAG2699087.1 hypothetical protein I3760_07G176000 [Carya illinoinensis]KAG2699088.1 hypothetical protein I3760_07G176000 [Carya illinoinensis]
MASASVVENLSLEALRLVDLRLLSQPELYSLSLCSSSSSYTSFSNDNDDVLIPKIDRSVFNESAGSRKQTYSRLRLAPRKPHSSSTSAPTRSSSSSFSIPRQIPEPLDEENSQIISILKELFAAETPSTADEDNLVSVPLEFEEFLPDLSCAGLQNVPVQVLSGDNGQGKRKRGRPRKDENRMIERKVALERKAEPNFPVDAAATEGENKRKRGRPRKNLNPKIESDQSERNMAMLCENVEEKEVEMVMASKRVDVPDVAALGNVEDPYGEELKRRTEGLQTEAELLGFLGGLNGEWWKKSRKKRIVLASDYGHALPKGWRLMLSIKKRASRVWLHCRRYISPNGRQFVSCKEVSSYFLSSSGLQDASQLRSGHTNDNYLVAREADHADDVDLNLGDGKNADDLISSPPPMTSILTDNEEHNTIKMGEPRIQTGELFKCHKCTTTFDEKNDLVHHLVSSHSDTANRCKSSTSISDNLIIIGEKYECQFCHKRFGERHLYNGHIGVHMGNYEKSVEASGITMQKSTDPTPTGVLPSTSMVHESRGIDWAETSIIKSGFGCKAIKSDTAIEACSDRDDQALIEEHSERPDKVFSMNNDKLGKVDVVTIVANRCNASLENETVSTNENISVCVSSDETNVCNCIPCGINNCVADNNGSESWSLASPINERTFVVENNVKVSFPSVEEQKLEIGSESGLNHKNKTCSGEDIEFKCFASTVEDMKVDDGCKSENSELVSSFGNHDIGLEYVCATVDSSGNTINTVGFGSNHASQNDKAVTSTKQEGSLGSCLVTASWNRQYIVENNTTKSSCCMVEAEAPFQGKLFHHHEFAPSLNEHGSHFNNRMTEVPTGAVEGLKSDEVRNCRIDEHRCVFKNHICSSTMEELKQDMGSSESGLHSQCGYEQNHDKINNVNKVSCSSIEEAKHKKVKSSWNAKTFLDFGTQVGTDADVRSTIQGQSSEGSSLVLSGDRQTFSSDNKVTSVCSSTVGKHERCSENLRDGGSMIDLGNQAQSNEEIMAELLWRTAEQNVGQNGLANISSPLVQSSGCFPNLMSSKASSHPEEARVLSYDAEMDQGFNSSYWLKKEALPSLPKVANGHPVRTMCVWCAEEFYLESVNSRMQSGSVGFMCAACNAKFSGQFNVL